MKINKFTTYEFDVNLSNKNYHIIYKKSEQENSNNCSFVSVTSPDDEKFNLCISLELLKAICEMMKEIDPFGFEFTNLDEEK